MGYEINNTYSVRDMLGTIGSDISYEMDERLEIQIKDMIKEEISK